MGDDIIPVPASVDIRTAADPAAKTVTAPRLSATTIALQLIREKGVLGLYKGFASTAMRDVAFSAIYFPLFAHLNALVCY